MIGYSIGISLFFTHPFILNHFGPTNSTETLKLYGFFGRNLFTLLCPIFSQGVALSSLHLPTRRSWSSKYCPEWPQGSATSTGSHLQCRLFLVARRAAGSNTFAHFHVDAGARHSEVADFQLLVLSHQYVAGSQISMRYVQRLEVSLKRRNDLSRNRSLTKKKRVEV